MTTAATSWLEGVDLTIPSLGNNVGDVCIKSLSEPIEMRLHELIEHFPQLLEVIGNTAV
jgi:hypothetical protein